MKLEIIEITQTKEFPSQVSKFIDLGQTWDNSVFMKYYKHRFCVVIVSTPAFESSDQSSNLIGGM